MTLWCVYILKCSDGTLYTGMTSSINDRINKHNAGLGAKYTRGRLPVQLVHLEKVANRSAALKREAAIKKLSRKAKLRLLNGG